MSECLCIQCDGSMQVMRMPQKEVAAFLGGSITFVGAIADFDAVAVALVTSDAAANRVTSLFPCWFDAGVCGDVMIVASDANGDEKDLDAETVRQTLLPRKE